MVRSRFNAPILVLGILAVSIAGCVGTDTTPTSGLEDTTWRLESYGEQGNLQSVLDGTEITATFESTKGQVRGSAGCNTYFAEYKVNGNKLSIFQMAYTEMACLEPEGILQQEQEYLQTLLAAEDYQVEDVKLQINCGDQILVYTSR